MRPTIMPGDYLVALNEPLAGPITRNDLWEVNAGVLGAARVIAMPGDRVQIKDGVVRVNGVIVRETYTMPYTGRAGDFPLATVYIVPESRYFVLNDNRSELFDSRNLRALPQEQFVAKILLDFRAGPPWISKRF